VTATRPAEPVRPARTTVVPDDAPPPAGAHAAPQPDADVAPGPAGGLTPAQRKTLQRRRLVMLLAFILLAVAVLLVGKFVRDRDGRRVAITPAASQLPAVQPSAGAATTTAARATTATTAAPATSAAAAAGTARATATMPADTANTTPARAPALAGAFTFAGGYGPVLGSAGKVFTFTVAVEKTLGQGNGGDFADEVDRVLGDPRSWIAARKLRLQRVPQAAGTAFTVYLASAKTSQQMCAAGGLDTKGFTSCRLPGQVIINNERWQDAVPDYGAPLTTYRAYAINHEVGHQLRQGHEACPGEGKPAPVMMQQTYGLKGCVANAWPYINGKRYAGPPIS